MQADADGEGCAASPDILRLACDALAQTLIAMQAEESLVPAALSVGSAVVPRSLQSLQDRTRDSQYSLQESSTASSSRGRRAALALESARTSAANVGGGAASRASSRTKSVIANIRNSMMLSSPSICDDGDSDDDEDSAAVCVGQLELSTYAR